MARILRLSRLRLTRRSWPTTQVPDAPDELLESMDADIFPLRRPDLSDKLDGAIGEFSPFHEMYGYYAHGIAPESFKAPEGWEQRLIQVEVERVGRNRPAVGWCLEPHDLVASKCAARRERDWEYAKVCVERGLVDREVLWERAQTLPIPADVLAYVLSVLGGILGRR